MPPIEMWIVVGIIFVWYVFSAASNTTKRRKLIDTYLQGIDDFDPVVKRIVCSNETKYFVAYAIDDKNFKLCGLKGNFNSRNNIKNVALKMLSFKDILASEIIEDGDSITSTQRGSQAAGAAIGALALGGVGAVIGGLSGKTKSSTEVTNLTVRVIVNNISDPIFDIVYFNGKIKKSDSTYKSIRDEAVRFHRAIEILIKKADELDSPDQKAKLEKKEATKPFSNSKVQELSKLAQLKEQGLVSDEEFEKLKADIVSS